MFLANDLIDMVNGEALHFTILRDCFSRQQSLYYYLNGNESSHEPTHGGIKENTFSEYLSSYSLEDSSKVYLKECIYHQLQVLKCLEF